MRVFLVLCLLAVGASAQLNGSTVGKAKIGCDFGSPNERWIKVDCESLDEATKAIALGKDVEFLAATRMTGLLGGEMLAIHGKVDGKCCSQRIAKMLGTRRVQPFRVFAEACCYKSCPDWMTC